MTSDAYANSVQLYRDLRFPLVLRQSIPAYQYRRCVSMCRNDYRWGEAVMSCFLLPWFTLRFYVQHSKTQVQPKGLLRRECNIRVLLQSSYPKINYRNRPQNTSELSRPSRFPNDTQRYSLRKRERKTIPQYLLYGIFSEPANLIMYNSR